MYVSEPTAPCCRASACSQGAACEVTGGAAGGMGGGLVKTLVKLIRPYSRDVGRGNSREGGGSPGSACRSSLSAWAGCP